VLAQQPWLKMVCGVLAQRGHKPWLKMLCGVLAQRGHKPCLKMLSRDPLEFLIYLKDKYWNIIKQG
jgi:hypothetical protein